MDPKSQRSISSRSYRGTIRLDAPAQRLALPEPDEELARNQRTRLYGAMIESVAQRGYQATTVAHVLGLAGVSRRAFYETFSNKEECFFATYDIVVARGRKLVLDAWGDGRGWDNRLHGSYKALLEDAAESPKGPRLVLVDALGVGPRARERMQMAGNTFERMVMAAYQLAPDDVGMARPIARAVVGGVRQILFLRLLDGRERELCMLTDEVLDWIEPYRAPAVARLAMPRPTAVPRELPRPSGLFVYDGARGRALASVLHLTLDEGYSALTDPQIAQFAGISTEAFHEQFSSKEECFLTLIDEFSTEALDAVRQGFESAAPWPEAVYSAIIAFVDYLVAHQALLRIAFIDLFEVGPGMIGRATKPIEGLTKLLAERGPAPRHGPAVALEAVTGALWRPSSDT